MFLCALVVMQLAALAPPRWRAAALTLSVAMLVLNGFSRIMLGVHWASDIVGGTMLGAAFALMGSWWMARSSKNDARREISLS